MQRALALQGKRDREEKDYSDHMAKLDAMLANERQRIRDEQLSEERSRQIEQKEQDLSRAKEMTISRPDSVRQPHGSTDADLGTQPRLPKPGKTMLRSNVEPQHATRPLLSPEQKSDSEWEYKQESEAKDLWEQQKRVENIRNDAIDSLMEMIGLEEVKTQILRLKAKIDASLRQNADMKQDRLNVAFLGNPGTGKTTVARLYAKTLTSLGVIPGDAFVETTGSRLAHEGVTGIKKILEGILSAAGGVLFVDEAYQLADQHKYGGKQVLDFLLAEMENNTGKIIFVLAGYNKEMEKFFEHNPGIPSRVPHRFQFTDYQDVELLWMLQQQIKNRYRTSGMKTEGGTGGLYMRIVIRRLGRNRGRPGFGNARALQTMLSAICGRQAGRLYNERRAGHKPDDFFLSKEDLIGPDPSKAILESVAWEKLQKLTGLIEVKKSIRSMIQRIAVNYQRELEEKAPIEVSLNRVFLGSPGTGKTSVAKLYGQILVDLGLLSNGEVVVKNPADFIGSALGQTESNTKAILSTTMGKVLVIDEAYSLYSGASGTGSQSDIYRTAVVDTIVAEVQSELGEDRCVLLLGYEEDMRTMFQNVNPGLSRRFAIESAFRFEDFTDSELLEILEMKMKHQDLEATETAKVVAIEVLSRGRNRPNFGNAGEVENLLNLAKGRYQDRQSSEAVTQDSFDVVFEPQDFDPDFKRAENADTNLQDLFKDVVGCEEIIDKLAGYQQIAHNLKSRGLPTGDLIPTNFLFKGPPGTGKTTTARKMGQVFFDLGMLAVVEVVECSASDLIGSYVGHTGPKTRAQLQKALGKVLFIDEAYRLAEGQFATEAVNELVDLLTKQNFKGKLVVILAGYDQDINNLISVNPGLSSRFPEQIVFQHMKLEHCLELLERSIKEQGIELPDLSDPQAPIHQQMIQRFQKMASLPSWGNARDIKTLANNIIGSVFRAKNSISGILETSGEDIIRFTESMLQERQDRTENVTKDIGTKLAETLPTRVPTRAQIARSLDAVAEPLAINTTHSETVATPESSPPPLFPLEEEETHRDAGVSDEIWMQLQTDIQMANSQNQISDDDIQKGEQAMSIAMAKEQQETAALQKSHEAIVQDELEAREHESKQEEARIREEAARKAREKAKAELERLRLAKAKQKRENQIQARLQEMGVCCMGYPWIKQSSGYRCAGGSHYISNEQLGV